MYELDIIAQRFVERCSQKAKKLIFTVFVIFLRIRFAFFLKVRILLFIFKNSEMYKNDMVGVAQLVELQIVVLAVAGSSPVAHPSLRPSDYVWRSQ